MQLDLSTLSTPELRALLDSARARGQAAQSYRILQEMAVRRETEPQPKSRQKALKARKRRPDEPRIITLDLGDPLERRDVLADEDFDVPPMPPRAAVADAADDPIAGLTLAEAKAPAAPAEPPRKSRPRIAVFVTGATMGVVAGWAGATATAGGAPWTSLALPELPQFGLPGLPMPDLAAFVGGSTPAAEPAPDIQVAELPPAPTGEAAPPLPLEIAAIPAESLAEDAAAQSPEPVVEPAPALAVPPPPPPPVEEASACDGEPTPADRAICADPALQKLQRELRQAYARALDAHADRATLRQRQLAWRDARDGVDDPEKLAALYEARIQKLTTATAEAKRLASR